MSFETKEIAIAFAANRNIKNIQRILKTFCNNYQP